LIENEQNDEMEMQQTVQSSLLGLLGRLRQTSTKNNESRQATPTNDGNLRPPNVGMNGAKSWVCKICTFENSLQNAVCDACQDQL
jgi:hypothetical protein